MADQETLERKDEVNPLAMSDEEMANFDPSTLTAAPAAEKTEESPDPEDQSKGTETSANSETPSTDKTNEDDDIDPENPDTGSTDEKKPEEEPKGEAERKPEGSDEGKTDESKPDGEKKSEETSTVTDFEANWKELTKPFKANGREMQVNSVEDARALMQMGANYNKKMAALKPSLKVLKLLENNGLLSEEKLSFLIDLDKKNPDAIGKLIKDSGIDPLDLNAEKASEYKPNTYTVDDREIDLDSALESIKDTPAYTRTLDVVSNKWDSASKRVIADAPKLLEVINAHVESGIYDLITAEVERERMFGRLSGLSDIEAYRQVGDAIQARGGFNHLTKGEEPAKKPVVVTPKPKQADDDKLKEKKRAASSSKPAVPTTTPADFNPLALSDEEFSKQIHGKFL